MKEFVFALCMLVVALWWPIGWWLVLNAAIRSLNTKEVLDV